MFLYIPLLKLTLLVEQKLAEFTPKPLTQRQGNNFLTLNKLTRKSEESGVVFMSGTKECMQPIEFLGKVEAILEEFKDICSEELPSGLPPL